MALHQHSSGLAYYHVRSQVDGPHLLLLGGVHGNEICGPFALARLAHELAAGLLTLSAGQVTIVPVANPVAYQQGTRFVKDNLNRIIRPYADPQWPEQSYADALAQLIDAADVVLDLHAYHAGTIPYVFLDQDDAPHRDFALALGLPHWITGWPELYRDQPKTDWSCDTIGYAQQQGKIGLLVECGHYQDAQSIMVADRVARRALMHFGVCQMSELVQASPPKCIKVKQIIWHDRPGEFVQSWVNLQSCKAGEPIITYADGTQWCAPEDGIIVLPNASAAPHHEWFYWAVKVVI